MKGNTSTRPDPLPALLLALGFALSAVAVYAVIAGVGAGLLGGLRTHPSAWVIAGAVLGWFVLVDAGAFGLRTPMWRRQTPKWFMYRFGNRTTAFLWGIDTGLGFTTFRITSLTWAAFSLTFLGVLPWWVGAVYAAGFIVPELAASLVIPRRRATGESDPEPGWVPELLLRIRPRMELVGVVLLATGGLWSLYSAGTGFGWL